MDDEEDDEDEDYEDEDLEDDDDDDYDDEDEDAQPDTRELWRGEMREEKDKKTTVDVSFSIKSFNKC